MIKQFSDFSTTQAYTGSEKLPAGTAYICRIVGTKVESYDWGQVIAIAFDIDEGDYKGFYKNQFDTNTSEDKKWKGTYRLNVPKDDGTKQDGWTKRRFKTFTDALEDSNSGYHFDWDETKFKGKLFGATFVNQFYSMDNGTEGTYTAVYDVISTTAAKAGKYRKIPDVYVPKKLADAYERYKAGQSSSSEKKEDMGFLNVPEGTDEDIPF